MNINEIMKKFEELETDNLIAAMPLEKRDESKLLVINREKREIYHKRFFDIPDYFSEGDCLVINKTKVIKTRLIAVSETGAKRDIIFISNYENNSRKWQCLAQKLSINKKYYIDKDIYFIPISLNLDGGYIVEFNRDITLDEIEKKGTVPLPHYIIKQRKNLGLKEISQEDDKKYQTVYASFKGSIAAPTAGFHFTEEIFRRLNKKGVIIAEIILHIGYGTFKMVRTEPQNFIMPKEYLIIKEEEAKKINNAKKAGKRIFVVGTSSMRALEKMNDGNFVIPGEGYSDIFIKPGWRFKIADCFITNLHLPHSPPLYMTLAFTKDPQLLLKAYSQAVEMKYRFYSYGDCSLIL